MRLSRTIAYAIHAIVQLARASPGAPIPCSQLAREGHMPERFLVQILRTLVTHGLLRSTCGVAGGYSLSRAPERITLRDIVEAFDNPLQVTLPVLECMSPAVRSSVVETLQSVAEAARAKLQKLTVADLIGLPLEQAETVWTKPHSAAEIGLPFLESKDYDTPADDSPAIR